MHYFRLIIFGALCDFIALVSGVHKLSNHHTHLVKSSKIESGIFKRNTDKRSILVTFGSTSDMKGLASQISEKYGQYPKEQRVYALYEAFNDYSLECQNSADSYLKSSSYTYTKMWASNMIAIVDADLECAEMLAQMSDVTSIIANKKIPLAPVEVEPLTTGNGDSTSFGWGRTWGLSRINVEEAWKFRYGETQYYGEQGGLLRGEGVIVAHIDSGVRATHESLKDSFKGFQGWADGYHKSKTPEDLMGHGTHTMGTIVGTFGIGVAPGAQWISCRGCFIEDCTYSALLYCCQWILCPYNTSTTSGPKSYKDCYSAPDLVSNSWGGDQGDPTFDRCILGLQAAGIIPIFSMGNSGPECGTANSPGDNPYVIGVGATDQDDSLAWFSSVGPPVTQAKIKPEICGPGWRTISAYIESDVSYAIMSGTSMAAPHVAGVVALMLQRCHLPYKLVLHILESTAETFLGKSNHLCGGNASDVFPNYFYGFGRVDSFRAVKQAAAYCDSYGYGGGQTANYGYTQGNSYVRAPLSVSHSLYPQLLQPVYQAS